MSVYLIQAGDGPIKIGFSEKPEYRLIKMQADCPAPLRIIGLVEGGRDREAELHAKFAVHRQNGEWFAPAQEILDFCEKHSPAEKFRLTSEFPIINRLGGMAIVCPMLGISIGALRVQARRGHLSRKQIYKLMDAADARCMPYTLQDFLPLQHINGEPA